MPHDPPPVPARAHFLICYAHRYDGLIASQSSGQSAFPDLLRSINDGVFHVASSGQSAFPDLLRSYAEVPPIGWEFRPERIS